MAESHREEIAKLEALYASNPGGRVFVHLAEAYRKAGELDRARSIVTEGLARHADSASGYVVLGRVLADQQNRSEAEVAFRRVLELDGGNLVALRGLGDLARLDDRPHEAIGFYREVLARNPSNDEVRELVDRLGQLPPPAEIPDDGGYQLGDTAMEPQAPAAAAPGNAGEPPAQEIEFGVVDIDALPGDLASFAGLENPETPLGDEGELDWSDESLFIDDSAAEAEGSVDLADLDQEFSTEPIDLHLLDASAGDLTEMEDETGTTGGDLSLELPTDGFFGTEPEPAADFEALTGDIVLEEDAHEPPPHGDPLLDFAPVEGTPDFAPVEGTPHSDSSLDQPGGDDPFASDSVELGMAADLPGSGSEEDTAAALAGESAPDVAADVDAGPGDEMPADIAEAAGDDFDTTGVFDDTPADMAELVVIEGAAEPVADSGEYAGAEMITDAAGDAAMAADGALEAEDATIDADDVAPDAEDVAAGGDDAVEHAAASADEVPEIPPYATDSEAVMAEAAAATPMMSGVDVGGFGNALGGPAAEPGDAALMTETMAELYSAQGFHDRAAEVYRALLRQRPGDERLAERLAHAEEAIAAAAPANVESLVEEDESGEVWLRGVGAPMADASPDDHASPYAWTETGEESGAGEPIGALLQSILAWRPAAAPAAPEPDEPEPLLLEDLAEPAAPAQPAAAPADEPWLAGTAPAAPAPAPAPPADEPWMTATPAGDEPWAAPAASAAPVTPPPAPPVRPSRQTENPVEAAFDEWYTGGGAEPAGGEASAPAAEAASPASPGSSADEPEQDDEDLEMFRSWLQSLKK